MNSTYAPISVLRHLHGHPARCQKLTAAGALLVSLAGLVKVRRFTAQQVHDAIHPYAKLGINGIRRALANAVAVGLLRQHTAGKVARFSRAWGPKVRKFDFTPLDGAGGRQQLAAIILQFPVHNLQKGGRRQGCVARFAGISVWTVREAVRKLVREGILKFKTWSGTRFYYPSPAAEADAGEQKAVESPTTADEGAQKAPSSPVSALSTTKSVVRKAMNLLSTALAGATMPAVSSGPSSIRRQALKSYREWLDSGEPIDSLTREQQLDIICGRWVLFVAKLGGGTGRIDKFQRASIASVLDWLTALEDDGVDPRTETLVQLRGDAPAGMILDSIAALFTKAFTGFTYRTSVIFQVGEEGNFSEYAIQALLDLSKGKLQRKAATPHTSLAEVFQAVHQGKGTPSARPVGWKPTGKAAIAARSAAFEARNPGLRARAEAKFAAREAARKAAAGAET